MENTQTDSRSTLLKHLAQHGYTVGAQSVGKRRCPLVIHKRTVRRG